VAGECFHSARVIAKTKDLQRNNNGEAHESTMAR